MTTRRDVLKTLPAAGAFMVAGGSLIEGGPIARAQTAVPAAGHFHPKGKAPSKFTLDMLAQSRDTLPFSDTRDFDENQRGLIAKMTEMQIPSDAGGIAWDMGAFSFLDDQDEFDSIHPSLLRQAKLNQDYGLYKVTDDIYQVRGFDLSQVSFVRGKSGWIVFDPLISTETARAALALFREHVDDLPISAIIYSHNHGDHWGGVQGIVDEADVQSGRIPVIAPVGFLQNAIEENVFAGNAMSRRLFYQYGILLPVSPYGFVTQGLGQGTSKGTSGLIAPTRIVADSIEEFQVDGVRMIFQNTPDTEAPSEMNTYIPDMKALWMAENVTATMHNIYTLRGAPVRDALGWSKYIAEALYLFGQDAEVMFASHHWPRWGNKRIQEVLRAQRDLYAHLNNQVLHLANQGVTINQIHNHYRMPKSLEAQWHTRGYHGSPEHNSRGVLQRFLGFWDCNPATLIPHSPEDSAPLYVEMMGGAGAILDRGRELHDQGEYLLASEILNKLVLAEPQNQDAKDLLADVFEQLGYQQENPRLRNSFLSGAFELRSGVPSGNIPDGSSPDIIRAMSTGLFLDFLGIRMDSRKAEEMEFTINLVTPDNDERFVIELQNATLTNTQGFLSENPDLSLTLNRADLERVMTGEATFDGLIADGTVQLEGDPEILVRLGSLMVNFTPDFEVLPGTRQTTVEMAGSEAFEADTGVPIPE